MSPILRHESAASGVREGSLASSPKVTLLLGRAERGDRGATDELFALVYEELRRLADQLLADEQAGQTLQPTALVHEAYLRLVGPSVSSWESRAHFFAAAALAIRRILIDRARARQRLRRGEGRRGLPIEAAQDLVVRDSPLDVLALDEALQRLAQLDPRKARVVELRFFGGLSVDETATTLGTSPSSVAREWRFARVWLHRELDASGQAAHASIAES